MSQPPPETIQQRPRSGATRCPYCHDECGASQSACACADCLSRHHVACWDEAGRCSSCGSTNRLQAAPASLESPSGTAGKQSYAEVIDTWVKLAAVYNTSLVLVTVSLLGLAGRLVNNFGDVVGLMLLGNLAFLSGPASELALMRVGFTNTKPFRWTVFGIGYFFALMLALEVCRLIVLEPMN